jgi:glutathione S-transferase
MLKLYYVPGTCALCPHIVLHESGLDFTLDEVSRTDKKTRTGEDYTAINPKTNVPTLLMDNGEILTEVAVIAQYIADLAPNSKLAPALGTLARYRLQEWLNFISSEIHKGCSPLFNPNLSEDAKAALKPRLLQRIGYVANALDKGNYLMEQFSVADAYLFTVLRWTPRLNLDLSTWPVLADYMTRIAARPAVVSAMREEGLIPG